MEIATMLNRFFKRFVRTIIGAKLYFESLAPSARPRGTHRFQYPFWAILVSLGLRARGETIHLRKPMHLTMPIRSAWIPSGRGRREEQELEGMDIWRADARNSSRPPYFQRQTRQFSLASEIVMYPRSAFVGEALSQKSGCNLSAL
jgi:hypothetical protein